MALPARAGRTASLVGASTLAVTALLATPAAAIEPYDYVALGDSAAAGPLIGQPDPNLACLRSESNYPHVLAEDLGAELTDVTCSGAEISDLSGRQYGFVPPQYKALSESTDLVTLTISGNDIDMVQAALSCINALPEPVGFSCADRYTAGGGDELADRIEQVRPRFGAALDEIQRRAPNAEVVVTGYGTYLRENGCYPREPMWARDANYVQASVDRLSAMIGEETERRNLTFVDLGPLSEGHDVCAAPRDKYFEGLIPSSIAAPLHPNAQGMRAFAEEISSEVTSVDTMPVP